MSGDRDLHAAYREDVAPWFDALERDPLAGLEAFFLEHRQARWFGASRLSTSLAATPRTILLDDAVLAACRGVPALELVQETLVRDVLHQLEPRLLDVPFVGSRLGCDVARRRGPDPVPAVRATGASFSWKVHFDAPFAAVLHREAARAPLVDRAALDRLDPAGPANAAEARTRWALATTGSLHDPCWYDPGARVDRDPEMVDVSARRVERDAPAGPRRVRSLLDLARRDPRQVPGTVLRTARRATRRH